MLSQEEFKPAIDGMWFPNTPTSFFWSGSPVAGGPPYAWSVYFLVGNAKVDFRSRANQVRLVRAGQ